MTLFGPGDLAPRRRRHRVRHAVVPLVAFIAVLVIAGVGYWLLKHPGGTKAASPPCSTAAAVPSTQQPVSVRSVQLQVLNGTGRTGLARDTAAALSDRGFRVVGIGNAPLPLAGVPAVHYPIGGLDAARLVALQLPRASLVLDRHVKTGQIELIIGSGFTRLRTPAEVKLASAPKPHAAPRPKVAASPAKANRSASPAKRPTVSCSP